RSGPKQRQPVPGRCGHWRRASRAGIRPAVVLEQADPGQRLRQHPAWAARSSQRLFQLAGSEVTVLPANVPPSGPSTPPSGPTPYRFIETARAIENEVGHVIIGQPEVVRGVLTCLLAGGHALLEGIPGLGKTLLVRTIGEALELSFSRVQFTPDLMPADITGTSILRDGADGSRSFEFQPGPLFANLVLADEVNRATPKTQSALLEAMQERRVTAGRTTHTLPEPFFVLATQNPIEMEGTYPLPEAQLDRFLFKLTVPYPSEEDLL